MILPLAQDSTSRDLPNARVVSVHIGIHDTVAGNSAKVLEILQSCQEMKARDHVMNQEIQRLPR